MMNPSKFLPLCALVLALSFAACGDDDDPVDGGDTDTTPPGVVAVTPIDVFHVDVNFNEAVSKASAEDENNYTLTEAGTPSPAPGTNRAPGDPIPIVAVTLQSNGAAVTITTTATMAGKQIDLTVDNVRDAHGNGIESPIGRTFTGSIVGDETAPQIVSRSPAPGATNVPVGTAVTVQFSEYVTYASVQSVATWETSGVPLEFTIHPDGTTFTFIPAEALDNNAVQTILLDGVQDPSGNVMPNTQWTFTTTDASDDTPPTLVSTSPANNATNVDVNASLSLTFSEVVNQFAFNVTLTPSPGDGSSTWSNGGKTITFDPSDPLIDDQQYVLTIYPDGVRDLAGNGIHGLHTVVFTTGSEFESGSIAGTISGHSGTEAADPTGATVIAADGVVLGGAFNILGSTKVADNNTYTLSRLPAGTYYVLALLDTNDNGILEPGEGDAVGAYGVNVPGLDFDADSVVVTGAPVTGRNFAIYDPTAIIGSVTYSGSHVEESWQLYVGLFASPDFLSEPVASSEGFWPGSTEWGFNSFIDGFANGTYYVGAFMDVNDNATFDPLVDPAGAYGGVASPTALNVSNGNDFTGIVISLEDPAAARSLGTESVVWPRSKQNQAFKHLFDLAAQAHLTSK